MAYAARLLPRIQPSASPGAAPLSDLRRPSFLRVGALCESPTIQKKMSVANSATAFGYMGEVGADFEVYRNDEISVDEIKKISPRGIISPGPGTPQDSGISLQTVKELGPSIPLFGGCMGLRCMREAFGGKGSLGAAVKLLPCDHEVIGSSLGNNILQKYRENCVQKTQSD